MPSGKKTSVEKNIWKITYPSGTIRYRVEFSGKGTELYALEKSLTKAREIKAEHLEKHPELIPRTPAEVREYNIKKARVVKVPGTKFIAEYETRPGTYNIKISRAKKAGEKKITLTDTVVGLANAKKREKELIAEMEKLTGRGIDVVDYKPPNPLYEKALADVKKQMTKWNKLGYYPKDILVKISDKYKFPYVKGEGANRQLSQYVRKAGLIDYDNLQPLSSKYITAIENYKKYKGDKTKVGVKKSILEKVGLPSKAADVATFRMALNRIGKNVVEDIKLEGEQTQRNITKKLGEKSALNIEDFLTGKKMGDLQVTGKKGSLLDKMHLADKTGLIRIGEMGYGSSKLNQMLGGGFKRTEGAERHRVALNKHMDKIIKKFKGNPDAMYTISPGPDSFDQKKFKNALQREFGKSKGQVPLAQYINKILNEEARLMGTATDGLITTRQIDPVTLERMKPSYGLSGSRTLPPVGQITDDLTLQELGLEKKQAGFRKVTPRLQDLETSANLAFQSADINIKNMKLSPARMNSIVDSIDKMLAAGLQNAKYEEISRLAKQCTLLRADGGRIAFAEGGPCAQAQKAVRSLDNTDMVKIGSNIDDAMQGPMGKLRDVSRTLIQSPLLKKGGKFGALAAVGAGAAAIVKPFMNDDVSTYLSNEGQQKNMLKSMILDPITQPDEKITEDEVNVFDKAYLPTLGAVTAAGAIPGGKRLFDVRKRMGAGNIRAALSPIRGVLGKGLAATGTPLGIAALEPLYLASQISEGDSLGEIATNPLNYLAPAFTGGLSREATRFVGPTASKVMRLGISPTALKTFSRRFGLPGLALSSGISGFEMLQNYRAGRGLFDDG
jgi:hypothetical protein